MDTALVSLHVRLCCLSTYIYFSCLFGLWRTSVLSRSSWRPCPFRLTGLSSSIHNPAPALWQTSFWFLLLSMKRDGQKCPSHFSPFRWNQRGHSVTRYPSGALFTPLPSISVRLYQGLSLCSGSARTVLMRWFRTLRLPDSHADTSCELIAQSGWMDSMWWYSMSLCDCCRTASGCATA